VLLGLGPNALTALRSIAKHTQVLAVVRNADRGDPVVELARQLGAEVSSELAPAAVDALVGRLSPACVVVSSYDRVLREALLGRCKWVNVHYAPLPQYRGRANVNWALINGESAVGITIHELSPGLDAGDILFQQLVPIDESQTIGDLYDALNELQERHLGETVLRFINGYEGTLQDEREATYGCSRGPDDGEIDWSQTTDRIHRFIRALTDPFPGAFTFFHGKRLIVWAAKPVSDPPKYVGRIPGKVIRISAANGTVDVLTGDGVIRLSEVQFDGDPRVPAAEVIRSVRASLGLSRLDLLRRIEMLEQALREVNSSAYGEYGTP
jgi:methionyl-tRNA formyltransferase